MGREILTTHGIVELCNESTAHMITSKKSSPTFSTQGLLVSGCFLEEMDVSPSG